ncbi:MAG: N-acetyltransferase [Firmicutes bacterium]|nr:N-acetyltransferase [Bacillota bacterium]
MPNITFSSGNEELLNIIQPLWEQLNEHHRSKTQHFQQYYTKFTFDKRKASLLELANTGTIRVDLAKDLAADHYAGYCVSTIDQDQNGEIQSLFVEPDYRKLGIGGKFMERALARLDENSAKKISISVAGGNEQAFAFYRQYGFFPRRTTLERLL